MLHVAACVNARSIYRQPLPRSNVPTAVHHCPNPQRATPGLICSQTPWRTDSPQQPCRVSLRFYPVERCRVPAASDNPLGVCFERGIITHLPLIAALMVIQPSVLPAVRLLRRASIGKGRMVSHDLASSHWTTDLSIKLKTGCETLGRFR